MTETRVSLPPCSGAEAICPKCGNRSVRSTWLDACPSAPERVQRHCACGYSWQEAPLDATPPEPESPRPTIVCLCGSTRFSDAYREANLRETLLGKIVLTIGCDMKSDDALGLPDDTKTFLDNLHFHKINLADEILVLNVGGYIGESTQNEITYAREQGKRIRWLETPDDPDEAAFRAGELLSRIEEHVPPDAQEPASTARKADEQPESQDRQLARLQRTMMVDHEPSIPLSRVVAALAEPIITYEHLATVDSPGGRMAWPEHDRHCVALHYSLAVNLDISEALRAELARRKGAA